jgi:hypothetical protein
VAVLVCHEGGGHEGGAGVSGRGGQARASVRDRGDGRTTEEAVTRDDIRTLRDATCCNELLAHTSGAHEVGVLLSAHGALFADG